MEKTVYEANVVVQTGRNKCKKYAFGYYANEQEAEKNIKKRFFGKYLIDLKKIDYNAATESKKKNIDEHFVTA